MSSIEPASGVDRCPVELRGESSDAWRAYRDMRNRSIPSAGERSAYVDDRGVVVCGYGLNRRVLLAPHYTTSHPFRSTRHVMGRTLIDTEGDEHDRLKDALGPLFRRSTIDDLVHDVIEPVTRQLLDELAAGGSFQRFCTDLPAQVLAHMLGLTLHDTRWWHERLAIVFAYIGGVGNLTDAVAARRDLEAAIRQSVCTGPGDVPPWAAMLEPDDVVRITLSLLAAGTETTTIAMSTVMAALLDHREWIDLVRSDRQLLRQFISESLRVDPPVHTTVRFATDKGTVAGHPVPKGGEVTLVLASGNRDDAVRAGGDDWDPRRSTGGIEGLTFGGGRHACIGAALALRELEVAFALLLDAFEIDGNCVPEDRGPHVVFARYRLDVTLTPRRVDDPGD